MLKLKSVFSVIAVFLLVTIAYAQKEKVAVISQLDKQYPHYASLAQRIWKLAEPGYMETETSKLLQKELQDQGFSITTGVAEMPTAFVASYGKGAPVISILAEMDALPGLSQDSVPVRKPLVPNAYGHACGHNLFGVGSVAAAIAAKNYLQQSGKSGTIQLIGTPAEEGAGGGKTYLVKAGLFSNVDAVLHWHPGDGNSASPSSSLAYRVANFQFNGLAAHAAAAPEKGRSALDAVEAMNYMVNMMREHVTSTTRIHYVIKKGGLTSNIVPDYAEVEYTIRHPTAKGLEEVWARLMKTAQAAALGTETTMTYEVLAGLYNLLPNETLAKLMQKNLEQVGGNRYTPEETEFADKIRKTVNSESLPPLSRASEIQPYALNGVGSASTDVGDVSWVLPTAGLSTSTWVPGVPAHSWQAVACDGMSIGFKGMLIAAKTISLTAIDLFQQPATVQQAKTELYKARGGEAFTYKSLAGDRKPPLDYRK
ncbi:amidohydrolase [Spirosoma sp. KCTC 42546]|uniref:amidohydrolase n=1 Tax=Spirosoma sp. KCTC 42546 TaxID=2520506 RepID=UPI00115A2ECE|nr:amidohydrolase [Spirosoma sp. KCTC 42546]QDK79796.1 amidohydrolase [Spirosoma sp. KCTC 42546]